MNENDKIVEINKSSDNIPRENMINIDVCAQIPEMPTNPQYAYAYIKFQNNVELCNPQNALENGTVFPQLNMPYCGWNSRMVR